MAIPMRGPQSKIRIDGKAKAVRDIFLAYARREPTAHEVSRYRGLGNETIKSIAEGVYATEFKMSREQTILNNAMMTAKEFGVSLVSTYNKQCGIATYTENLYRELRDLGIRANVISDEDRNRMEQSPECGVSKSWNVEKDDFCFRIIEAAGNFANSIVHIQHEFGLFRDNNRFLEMVNHLKGCGFAVVITLHTVLGRKDLDAFYRTANLLIVHHELAAHRLYGNNVSNVTVIKHGTEEPIQVDKQDARDFFGSFFNKKPGPNDFLGISAGFISRNKLQKELLHGVKLARKALPNLKFLLVGSVARHMCDENYFEELKSLEDDNIRVVQRFTTRKEMAKILTAADFGVLNYEQTDYSTSGMSHYMLTYGVPTVTSMSRILWDLDDSVSVKIGGENPEAIASAILRLCESDPKLLENMRKRALEQARKSSWNETAKTHVRVYETLHEMRGK